VSGGKIVKNGNKKKKGAVSVTPPSLEVIGARAMLSERYK